MHMSESKASMLGSVFTWRQFDKNNVDNPCKSLLSTYPQNPRAILKFQEDDEEMNDLIARENGWLKALDVERRYHDVCQCLVQSFVSKLLPHDIVKVFSIVFGSRHCFDHLRNRCERATAKF